jgi:suppressor of G2 allele of SKP1
MSSATAFADAGVQAVSAGRYAEGVEKLTEALKQRPAPLWYLERSKAHLRTNQFNLALYDAEMALNIAFGRANRDQMMEAQIRRAITFFRMGWFADADVCAFWAIRLSDGAKAQEDDGQQNKIDSNGDYTVRADEVHDEAKPEAGAGLNAALQSASTRTKQTSLRNQALSWRIQALTQMEKLPVGHDGRKLHSPVKYPEPSEISASKETQHKSPATATHGDTAGGKGNSSDTTSTTSSRDAWEKIWARYHDMYTKNKIRCSFYQTETSLTVDIFVKNLSKEQVSIDTESQTVKLNTTQGASFGGYGGPIVLLLFGEVKPELTKYNVKSMKIELILQKQIPGKWPSLRRENADIVDNLSMNPSQGVPFSQFFEFITKSGYKDTAVLELPDPDGDPSVWYATLLDKLRSNVGAGSSSSETKTITPSHPITEADGSAEKAAAVTHKENMAAPAYPTSSKTGPKNWDTLDIDENDDEKGDAQDSDVNAFFQRIYKDADPDTKRAMMKSFIESNGTSLSTSWADAGSKTFKTVPPDGVEAKKWE